MGNEPTEAAVLKSLQVQQRIFQLVARSMQLGGVRVTYSEPDAKDVAEALWSMLGYSTSELSERDGIMYRRAWTRGMRDGQRFHVEVCYLDIGEAELEAEHRAALAHGDLAHASLCVAAKVDACARHMVADRRADTFGAVP